MQKLSFILICLEKNSHSPVVIQENKIDIKLILHPKTKQTKIFIKIADKIKAESPANDLPLNKGFPILIPTIAAAASETIKIIIAVIAISFDEIITTVKNPRNK